MVFLLFQLGPDRYALEARRVVEVLPYVALKRLPLAPKGVAGILNYRGRPVPAVDLSELTLGRPVGECLTTRILLVHHPDGSGQERLLGLLVEHATDILRTEPERFVEHGVKLGGAPYLGPLLMDIRGPIQWFHEKQLLPEPMRRLIFSELCPVAA